MTPKTNPKKPNMKTLLSSLAFCAIVASATIVCSPSASFAADGNKPSHDKVADHITMKEGKLFLVKGTDKQALQEDVTLADGSKVTKEGHHVSKEGEKTALQDGDSISLDGGKIMKAGAAKDATATNKEPAKEGGNKSSQNVDNK